MNSTLKKLDSKVLRGAMDIIDCETRAYHYSVVKVSEETLRQSRALSDSITNSLEANPTPQPDPMSDLKWEFERLMQK